MKIFVLIILVVIVLPMMVLPVFAPSHPEYVGFEAPLKQIAQGVQPEEIKCNEELVLIIKKTGSPACVKPETAVKLEERGWGVMPPPCCKDMPHESLDEKIKIEFGQTVQFEALEFHFYDIDDSRCPLDVTCVWEGKVTVMINIKNQTHNIDEMFEPGDTISDFDPYEITLVEVLPHPITTEVPEYVATLSVSK